MSIILSVWVDLKIKTTQVPTMKPQQKHLDDPRAISYSSKQNHYQCERADSMSVWRDTMHIAGVYAFIVASSKSITDCHVPNITKSPHARDDELCNSIHCKPKRRLSNIMMRGRIVMGLRPSLKRFYMQHSPHHRLSDSRGPPMAFALKHYCSQWNL